jgi:hypothetical protein
MGPCRQWHGLYFRVGHAQRTVVAAAHKVPWWRRPPRAQNLGRTAAAAAAEQRRQRGTDRHNGVPATSTWILTGCLSAGRLYHCRRRRRCEFDRLAWDGPCSRLHDCGGLRALPAWLRALIASAPQEPTNPTLPPSSLSSASEPRERKEGAVRLRVRAVPGPDGRHESNAGAAGPATCSCMGAASQE